MTTSKRRGKERERVCVRGERCIYIYTHMHMGSKGLQIGIRPPIHDFSKLSIIWTPTKESNRERKTLGKSAKGELYCPEYAKCLETRKGIIILFLMLLYVCLDNAWKLPHYYYYRCCESDIPSDQPKENGDPDIRVYRYRYRHHGAGWLERWRAE